MIKRIYFLLLFNLIIWNYCFSQTFMHGVGSTVNIMIANIDNGSDKYTATLSFANVTYFPRYNLTETDHSSVSIGVPIGAGIGFANDIIGGESSIYYGFDFPLVVDYNSGRKSTYDNESKMGWYVGAGFGYTLTNWADGSSTEKLNSYGPIARAGIRFGAGRNNPDRGTTIGLCFKQGLEDTKFKTIGIAVLYEF